MFTREKPAGKTGTTMLKDLLFCGICGRKLTIRKENNGTHTIKPCGYVLPDGTGKCHNRGMRLQFLEEEVVWKIQAHKQQLEAHLQQLQEEELEHLTANLRRQLASIEAKLRESERQRSSLLQRALSGDFAPEEVGAEKQALTEQHQTLLETRDKIVQQIQDMDWTQSPAGKLTYIIRLLEEFEHLPAEVQNKVLKQFVKRICFERTMPEEIRSLSTKNPERQAHPFSYTIEYL